MNTPRYCTVAQLREALADLQPDDVLSTAPITGNFAVLREDHYIGYLDTNRYDFGQPPGVSLELLLDENVDPDD